MLSTNTSNLNSQLHLSISTKHSSSLSSSHVQRPKTVVDWLNLVQKVHGFYLYGFHIKSTCVYLLISNYSLHISQAHIYIELIPFLVIDYCINSTFSLSVSKLPHLVLYFSLLVLCLSPMNPLLTTGINL